MSTWRAPTTAAATAALDKAIQLRQDPTLYYRRAKLHADRDEWAKTRLDLEEGIRREPPGAKSRRVAAARVTLVQFKNRDGEYVAALVDCKAALDGVPGYSPAYGQRAATLHAMGKDDEAAAALDRYLFDPALSSANHFIYSVSLDTVASDGRVTRSLAFSTPCCRPVSWRATSPTLSAPPTAATTSSCSTPSTTASRSPFRQPSGYLTRRR